MQIECPWLKLQQVHRDSNLVKIKFLEKDKPRNSAAKVKQVSMRYHLDHKIFLFTIIKQKKNQILMIQLFLKIDS